MLFLHPTARLAQIIHELLYCFSLVPVNEGLNADQSTLLEGAVHGVPSVQGGRNPLNAELELGVASKRPAPPIASHHLHGLVFDDLAVAPEPHLRLDQLPGYLVALLLLVLGYWVAESYGVDGANNV